MGGGGEGLQCDRAGGHILPAATLQLKTGENKTALEVSPLPLPAHLTLKLLF